MAAPRSRGAFARQHFRRLYVDAGSLPEKAVGCDCAGLSDAASARGRPRIPALDLAAEAQAALGPAPLEVEPRRSLSSAIGDLVQLARSDSEGPTDAACAEICLEQAVGGNSGPSRPGLASKAAQTGLTCRSPS